MTSDPVFTSTKLNALINLHLPAVYDTLVAAGPADYYSSDATVSVTAGTIQYALPSDFLALVNVFVHEGDDYKRVIDAMPDRARQGFRAPQMAGTITVEYIPTCPVLDDDADTFDGVDGWDELVSAKVARDILVEREGDTSVVLGTIAMAEKRIRSYSTSRHRGGSNMLTDVESDICWPYSVQIDTFRLRASNIEFYTSIWGPYT